MVRHVARSCGQGLEPRRRRLPRNLVRNFCRWSPQFRQHRRVPLLGLVIVVDDQIETTINYADYVEKVEELVASSSFNLIETLAKYIYENLIDAKINKLIITVHKPNTALSKKTKDISVTYSG